MSLMIQPQALYQFTGSQLIEFAKAIIVATKEDVLTQKPKYMCTRQVKQHLLEKGFKVNSAPSFQSAISSLGVARVKRGKEYWYSTAEIEAIPSRIISK